MKKMVLAAPQNERESILNVLQSEGYVHLIDVKEEISDSEYLDCFKEPKSVIDTELDYNYIKFTYEFLKQYSVKKKGLLEKRPVVDKQEFDRLEDDMNWKDIYNQCKEIDETTNTIKSKKVKLTTLIEQYSQWKNLDVCDNDLEMLKNVTCFIGGVSKKQEMLLYEEINNSFGDVYIEKVSDEKQDLNLFILCHKDIKDQLEDVLKNYGYTKANLDLRLPPAEYIKELSEELESLDNDLKELSQKASGIAQNIEYVQKVYDYISNKLEKENAVFKLGKTRKTFILKGWIAAENADGIESMLTKDFDGIYIKFEEPSEEDMPPIILKNNALVEPFEVITSMYALPLPTEVDPTPVLTPFYMIFFGMMAADIGYGIVLLLATAFALKFMELEGDARKIIKLLLYVSFPTIFFGWVFGGFFGNALPVKPLWVNPLDEPMTVLYSSIALGLVHLFTGLGVKAYWFIKNGKAMDAVYDVLTWYLLLTGAIWMLLGGGNAAKIMAVAGAAGLLLTQGRANASLSGKIFGGIYGLYGVTGYIGDLLSYSRLLALGLATGLIGSSFNMLIQLLGGGIFVIVLGPIIFIAGHTFNLLIGLLGTYVHACRLQYLEFFGKFYEGGGKAFNPLKITTKFIKVNTEK
ncbi:V-type ATP synthase subunit I [Oxobacter pfennigii]|nr:V-type ATP synthase subunit I [Oxobacter pfennigii]